MPKITIDAEPTEVCDRYSYTVRFGTDDDEIVASILPKKIDFIDGDIVVTEFVHDDGKTLPIMWDFRDEDQYQKVGKVLVGMFPFAEVREIIVTVEKYYIVNFSFTALGQL